MSRKSRTKSALGIYHVMLRGINKQNIFFCEDDFVRMMEIIRDAPYEKAGTTGKIISDSLCTIYAYCILDNHIHLLIKEGTKSISDIMKSIEDRYAVYYNRKYERVGHLFQSRFPSEAVNDREYFYTLLRYIHRNPVKAMEAKTPEEYPFSSWNEYVGSKSNIMKVLKPSAIQATLEKFPLPELTAWVNMCNEDQCLDMDSFRYIITDSDAMDMLQEVSGVTNPEDFRLLDAPTQILFLLKCIDRGVNISQAARLGTITDYQLRKAYTKKCGESQKWGQSPFLKIVEKGGDIQIEDIQNRIRRIEGLTMRSYERLHLIAEYLQDNSSAKCQDIANFLGISNESARRSLVILSNEDVVSISGSGKMSAYSLKTVENLKNGN